MTILPGRAALLGAAFSFVVALAGCAAPGVGGQAAIERAREHGFVAGRLQAGEFDLLALRRAGTGDTLAIYIEGDGAEWLSPWHPPADPTPRRAVALELAAASSGAAVYLGRPCQYLDAAALRPCSPDYWTTRRFAPEVVAAYMAALDRLKAEQGAARLVLVGHSGGGVIATLLAARRDDVARLVTVAAPLAVGAWTAGHGVSALTGSLDPAAAEQTAPRAPAVHFVGERDKVVPPAIVERYVAARGGRIERLPGHDHECCWARDWPRLLERLQ